MTQLPIEVETSTKINHWALGHHFFDWNSEEQALFLHGAKCGRDDLGSYGHLQVKYIVDSAIEADTADQIRDFINLLHEYSKEDDA